MPAERFGEPGGGVRSCSAVLTQIEVPDTNLTLPVNQGREVCMAGSGQRVHQPGPGGWTFSARWMTTPLRQGHLPVDHPAVGQPDRGDVVDLGSSTPPPRNDPVNGITNKVDIFVDGIAPYPSAKPA